MVNISGLSPRLADKAPGTQLCCDYSEETEHRRTTSTNSMLQGKNITVDGGNFTYVTGDSHNHTFVIEDSTKGSNYLKAIRGKSRARSAWIESRLTKCYKKISL
jgi:hypothetical protein